MNKNRGSTPEEWKRRCALTMPSVKYIHVCNGRPFNIGRNKAKKEFRKSHRSFGAA